MKKGLGKFLLTGFIAGAVTGASVDFHRAEYNIDKSKIKENDALFSSITEYKGSNKIKYFESVFENKMNIVKINGEEYDRNDTLIFEEAQRRYNYLRTQIDSINLAKRESELQKKLDKEKEEQEKILEILRK